LLIASDYRPEAASFPHEEMPVSALAELQQVVTAAAATVGPSVVAVGRGAGVVVAPDQVLTNAHNLTGRGGAHVRFADGRREDGEVVAADLDGDLAVVTVPTGDAPIATWADTGPTLGATVVAFGSPRHGPARATIGFVSATDQAFRGPRDRRVHGAIEHTAPVGRGSSGGPIVDAEARVVGIDTHRRGDGFYLAIPASESLAARIAGLRRGEAPARRHLGVAVAPTDVARRLRSAVGLDDRDGVLVRHVEEDGVAARAGVSVGDLITRAGDVDVLEPDDLLRAIDTASGDLRLHLVRGSDVLEVTVTF
jgi:serine protease Do